MTLDPGLAFEYFMMGFHYRVRPFRWLVLYHSFDTSASLWLAPFFGTSFYADCNMSVLLITLQHKWIFVKCRIFKEWLALPNQQGKSQPYKQGKSQTSFNNPNSTRKIQSQQGKPKPNKENLSQQVKYHPTRNIRKNRCQSFVGQRRFSFSAFISVFAKPYYLFYL